MIAQVARLAQPPQAMAFLAEPGRVLAGKDPGHALGLRGVVLSALRQTNRLGNACWPQVCRCGPSVQWLGGDVLSSLMYGNFMVPKIRRRCQWGGNRLGALLGKMTEF